MPKKILLVEDEEYSYDLLRDRLRNKDYDVELATTGEQAIASAEADVPDLILMDIRLPGQNGYETTRAVRRLDGGRGADVPIIALTAHALEEDREKAITAGCDDYHAKPVHFSKLLEQMETLLEGPLSTRA